MRRRALNLALGVGLGAAVAAVDRPGGAARGVPVHPTPQAADGTLTVQLCDGVTTTAIPGVREGERPTPEQARGAADALMAAWRAQHPGAWDDDATPRLAQATPSAPPGSPRPAESQGPQQEGQTYGGFTDRDARIWQEETDRFVRWGHDVFHDAAAFGGTIGISCDMCHPDAANTHPETYPKFQVQLGRVALLRDMINWCIQNPARGRPLPDDDDRLKAMEAYILAQRKGAAMDYGKH